MTAVPRDDELDPAPVPGRDTPPGPITIGLVVTGGFLIGGPFGLAVALLALLVWRRQPDWLGAMVGGLLVVAALGSVVGAWPGSDSLRQSFADDRHWAAAAGLGAGVSLLVAVARAARADRALAPSFSEPATHHASLAQHIRPWLPFVGVALLAAVVSLLAAPDALSGGALAAAEALRAGEGFVRAPGTGPASYYPPAALVVAAVFPTALALVQAMLAGATAVATLVLGTRLAGRRVGVAAGALAAVLPMVWDQRLPGALAGLALLCALLLSWPDRLTVVRAATAGVLLTVATLARPEAVLAVPVVVAWVAVWPRRRDVAVDLRGLVALLVAVGVGFGVSAVSMHGHTGTWWAEQAVWPALPAGGTPGILPLAVNLVAVVLALSEAYRRWRAGTLSWSRHLPWLVVPLVGVVLAAVTLGDRSLWFALGPLVAVGAAVELDRGDRARRPRAQRVESSS